jgi:lytic murein transglycosylase
MPLKVFAILLSIGAAAGSSFVAGTAQAAQCGGDFGPWLQQLRRDTAAGGVGPKGLAALDGVTPDSTVISRDRGQQVFNQSFEQFSNRMITPRLNRGANEIRALGSLFDRIETRTGVPGPVLVAIWGLETDFGAVQGNFATIRSLATLAFDCRRADHFRAELIDALKIVDSGSLKDGQLRGAWAGEIGQTQFMPSSYLKFAAGRDLRSDSTAALSATADYLQSYGWQRSAGWEPGQPNFAVLKQWNDSDVYARTIASFATRMDQMVK